MMTLIRGILRTLLLFFDRVFAPRPKRVRPPQEQRALAPEFNKLKLYQLAGCPFCILVRRELKRLDIPLELRDIRLNQAWEEELVARGGKRQVPCLRIEGPTGETWMYESADIKSYLQSRFAGTQGV